MKNNAKNRDREQSIVIFLRFLITIKENPKITHDELNRVLNTSRATTWRARRFGKLYLNVKVHYSRKAGWKIEDWGFLDEDKLNNKDRLTI